MKVAIIGYGNVGMSVFNSMLNMREIHELVLVGRNKDKIMGEIEDHLDSMAINDSLKTRIGGGGYEMTEGADIIVFTASPPSNGSGDRRDMLEVSVNATRQVFGEINKYNRDAVIIVISNPVDALVKEIVSITGRPRQKVIGTGTLLDSARLCRQVAEIAGIPPVNVIGCVLGEHGDSSVVIWSALKILGMSVDELLSAELEDHVTVAKEKLLQLNQQLGWKIFVKKGSTSYGVAAAASRIASAIIHDTNEILPVSVAADGEYGIAPGVALSLPCHIGRNGAEPIGYMKMTDDELAALRRSAEIIRTTMCDKII